MGFWSACIQSLCMEWIHFINRYANFLSNRLADPELDPGGFSGLKKAQNEISWNQAKPIPLRLDRRTDSGHIFTFSN
jgi:hypothetical protein